MPDKTTLRRGLPPTLSRRGNPAGDESGRTLGGDYTVQRGRLNPYRQLFEQVTSRTRQHGLYNP